MPPVFRIALPLVALIAGCAEVPVAPAPAPGKPVTSPSAAAKPAGAARPEDPLAQAIAEREARAAKLRAAGDLLDAEAEWHVLTLLAPRESRYREELAVTRAAMTRMTAERLQAGAAAARSGDVDRAASAYLQVLAVDPGNVAAADALRDIEARRAGRTQAERAAKARPADAGASPGNRGSAAADQGYELEQRLELLQAGDLNGGLRELRAFVAARPQDRPARQRIGLALYERGRVAEGQGQRETALTLYDAAVALGVDTPPAWLGRAQALRKQIGNDYFEQGNRVARANPAAAVAALETSLRFDPGNSKTMARLVEVRAQLRQGPDPSRR